MSKPDGMTYHLFLPALSSVYWDSEHPTLEAAKRAGEEQAGDGFEIIYGARVFKSEVSDDQT